MGSHISKNDRHKTVFSGRHFPYKSFKLLSSKVLSVLLVVVHKTIKTDIERDTEVKSKTETMEKMMKIIFKKHDVKSDTVF